eukprot:365273_1
MAEYFQTTVINLLNIDLLYDKKIKERYTCGKCGKLAVKAQCLNCDSKYHSRNLTLYCQQCSSTMSAINKCPINNHINPKFHESIISQIEIEQHIEFICPFSASYNNINHNDDNKQNTCDWKGKYNQLLHHVKTCQHKPEKCLFNKTDNKHTKNESNTSHIQSIHNDHKQCNIPKQYIDDKMNKLTAETQQIIALQNEKFNQQIQTLQQHIIQKNVNITNQIKQINKDKSILKVVTICILLIAIIFGVIYNLKQQISTLNETCSNKSATQMSYNVGETIYMERDDTNVQHIEIISLDDLLKDDSKPIPLTIWSHKGHSVPNIPENIIKLGFESIYRKKSYCSKYGVTINDWIIFSVKDKNILYYPVKIQMKTRDSNKSVKRFIVFIGVSSMVKDEWIKLHDDIFIAEHSNGLQEFELNVDEIKWKQIQEKKYWQFKLEIMDNHGANDHICIKEFKIVAVELSHGSNK